MAARAEPVPTSTPTNALVCTIGAPQALFRFGSEFSGVGRSGYLAFLGPAEDHRLLVTDAGNNAVHVVDVAGQRDRGVAARGSRVAVSTWKALRWTERAQFDGQVCLFEGSGTSWVQLWTVLGPGGPIPGSPGGWLRQPNGLRFSVDGGEVVVADSAMDRVVVYSADDGRFLRQLGSDLPSPVDVQECAGGWIVACRSSLSLELVGALGSDGAHARLVSLSTHDAPRPGKLHLAPTALALLPDIGLVVRDCEASGRMWVKPCGWARVFSTPDAVAMATMSAVRVGWMVGVVRGRLVRSRREALPPAPRRAP